MKQMFFAGVVSIVTILLLVGGCSGKQKGSEKLSGEGDAEETGQAAETQATIMDFRSLKAAMDTNVPMRCKWESMNGTSGELEVQGMKFLRSQQGEGYTVDYVLSDGVDVYGWNSNDSQGVRMKLDDLRTPPAEGTAEGEASASDLPGIEQEVDLQCKQEELPASDFVPPAIPFKTFDELLEEYMQNGGGEEAAE